MRAPLKPLNKIECCDSPKGFRKCPMLPGDANLSESYNTSHGYYIRRQVFDRQRNKIKATNKRKIVSMLMLRSALSREIMLLGSMQAINCFMLCVKQISISFQTEWNVIVVTVFLSIFNQMEFHLNQTVNFEPNVIPFGSKSTGKLLPRSYPI